MKKLAIFTVAAVLIVLPKVAFAAWWNPLSWFSGPTPIEVQTPPVDNSPNSVASDTPAKPVVVPQSIGSDSSSVITKLQGEINALNQENTSLRNQLADAQAKYQQCVSQGTNTESNPNDEQASKLRVELATLDQVDNQLDNMVDDRDKLIAFLNSEKKLDGTALFPAPPKSVTAYWTYQNLNTVTMDYLHTVVDDYRTEVKIDLAKYEDVPN